MQVQIEATITQAYWDHYGACQRQEPPFNVGDAITITGIHIEANTVDFVTHRFQRRCTGQPFHLFPAAVLHEMKRHKTRA